jgi:hypothetical protein
MAAMERMVLWVTREQRKVIRSRAIAEKLPMGEIVRRSVERYGSQADEAPVEKLTKMVRQAAHRANIALDRGLAAIAAGMSRIERMERAAARRGKTKGTGRRRVSRSGPGMLCDGDQHELQDRLPRAPERGDERQARSALRIR